MISDLSSITEDLIRMIKSRCIAEAHQLVQNAHRTALSTSFTERQKSVQQINLLLFETKRQQSRIMETLEQLPTEDQLLARPKIERICRLLFDSQISELQSRKRRISHTRSDLI